MGRVLCGRKLAVSHRRDPVFSNFTRTFTLPRGENKSERQIVQLFVIHPT